uniref:Secreted protein n=1 Tax=Brassica oleracea var. oleracea TaxID=109376 RepID=A0A0D3EA28_BRAOL
MPPWLTCSKSLFFLSIASFGKYFLSNSRIKSAKVSGSGPRWPNRTPSHHTSASPRRYCIANLSETSGGHSIISNFRCRPSFQSYATVASTVPPKCSISMFRI